MRIETQRFLRDVSYALTSRSDGVEAALAASVAHALREAVTNPFVFITAVVTAARGGTDALLPFLISRPDQVLADARRVSGTRSSPPQFPQAVEKTFLAQWSDE
ncbi:hypothetical protein [Streptomyces sp. 1222.5]|uniref:hypothetical protein n=1 Tax=Streptomyces sp. 1222.5 TaxID=1881026 RepID=UPI003EC03793